MTRRRLSVVLAVAVFVAACGNGGDDDTTDTREPVTTAPRPASTTTGTSVGTSPATSASPTLPQPTSSRTTPTGASTTVAPTTAATTRAPAVPPGSGEQLDRARVRLAEVARTDEPIALATRGEEIYVAERVGIVRR